MSTPDPPEGGVELTDKLLLYRDGKMWSRYYGRYLTLEECKKYPMGDLVANIFVSPPTFPGAVLTYVNGDDTDWRADNLTWTTLKSQYQHYWNVLRRKRGVI